MPQIKSNVISKDVVPSQPITKQNSFSTTASGLIKFNFDDDSDNDDSFVPNSAADVSIPAELQENIGEEVSKRKNKKTALNQQPTHNPDKQAFFEEIALETYKPVQNNQINPKDEKKASYYQMMEDKINSHSSLLRKRSLMKNKIISVIEQPETVDAVINDNKISQVDEIKKKLIKNYRKTHYEIDDSDLDSDASDYDEDALPVLDDDVLASLTNRAQEMARQESNKEAKKDAAANNKTSKLSLLNDVQYDRAAAALQASDDEDETAATRFGDSDEEDDDGDEEELDEETKKALEGDIFENQTNVYTSDNSGDFVKINTNVTFNDMHLSKPTLISLQRNNFHKPTPIQAASVPLALRGFDIMANAVTGSGKTLAFLLPIIERLRRMPDRSSCIRAIIVTPTRELAEQIFQVAIKLTHITAGNPMANKGLQPINVSCIYGGVNLRAQETELRQNPDIVICTPGRMIDHLTNTAGVSIDNIDVMVLDEADRLLDMGFRDEVQHIIDLSSNHRQTLLFSATVNEDVESLIKKSLRGYKRILVDKASTIVQTLTQQFIRIRHDADLLRQSIVLSLCKREFKKRVIIFVKTKQQALELNILFKLCGLHSVELHGNLSQSQRQEALEMFRQQKIDILIATDIASRGLDIKGVLTVINMYLPLNYKTYVHRVGRTARAGERGTAISLVGEYDRKLLREMMKVHDAENDLSKLYGDKDDKVPEKKTTGKQTKEKPNNLLLNLKKREIAPQLIEKYSSKIEALQPHVDALIDEVRHLKSIDNAERDVTRAENLIIHSAEIKERQKRTWFQSSQEKQSVQQAQIDATKSAIREAKGEVDEAKALIHELDDISSENVKKAKKDPLKGLSRVQKRRKIAQMQQKGVVSELKQSLNDENLSTKQKSNIQRQITTMEHPEITTGYMKRQNKRQLLEDNQQSVKDRDGAGPEAFEKYAREFKKLDYQANAAKRQLKEEQLTSSHIRSDQRRYEVAINPEKTKVKRFKSVGKHQDDLDKQHEKDRRERAKPKKTAKFKSDQRYQRRKRK